MEVGLDVRVLVLGYFDLKYNNIIMIIKKYFIVFFYLWEVLGWVSL